MRAAEGIAVVCLGAAIVFFVWRSAVATLPAGDLRARTFQPPAPGAAPHGGLFAQGKGQRAGVDPLRPPGLPEGVRIDPATGLMSGMDLQARAGETALPWTRLAAADGVSRAAALPADLRELEGRRVVMAGFLMPLYEVDRIRQFLLVGSHYACCFGRPPGLGGMVMVTLAPRATALGPMLEPLRVRGRLHIRERREGPDPGDPLLLLFDIEDAEAAPLEYH